MPASRTFPVVFAIVFTLCFSPIQSAANTSEITKMLNDLETIVGVYERYVGRDPFCLQYTVIINGEVVPKLNRVTQQIKKHKGKKSFSPFLAKRYHNLTLRYSKAMMKLVDSMGKMEMCEPDQVKK